MNLKSMILNNKPGNPEKPITSLSKKAIIRRAKVLERRTKNLNRRVRISH